MSTLKKLCFVLPLDSEEIYPSDKKQKVYKKPPVSKTDSKTKHNVSSYTRRAIRWLCGSCQLCRCVDHYDPYRNSYEFEDIDGTDDSPNKKVASGNPRIFSYSELYIGTNGFSEKEVLGSGGFGRVYHAVLPSDGTSVAVKRVAGQGDRFEKAFMAELMAVAQLRHRNLVRLRGWCVHEDDLLLVYDYMPNLSLDRLLFTPALSGTQPLAWNQRRKIVSGLAAALYYLHEQLDTQIIHRDIKSSNVMLDSQFNARLGDFGLARWIEHASELGTPTMRSNSASVFQFRITDTSRIGGTIGYLPPESFQRKGDTTAKSDVFSFGIVVLELATGRRAVDLTYPDDQIFMLDWVRRLSDEGKVMNAGDNRLPDGSYTLSDMSWMVHLGLLCSLHDPRSRPTMKWVLENLSDSNLGSLPSLPSFKLLPNYISISSSTSTTTTAVTTATDISNTRSIYVTAVDSTIFVTADNGDAGSGGNSGNSRISQRSINSISNIDTPRQISYKEIVAITNNFSESQMVAELDFGSGYEGYLESKHVLVKRLGMKTCPALRTRFANELSNLARLRHRNLVQLRGWCTEQGEMLVVYDYSTTRLLSNHLFHRKNYVLPWHHRYNIIKSLASAVLYLHEEWEEKVIHRNITSSAVFLDHDMSPRLGCFALAEFLSRNEHGHHVVSSSARGIFGYMSPEYIESGEATTMADIYSFGVVVLEMVSGVAAVDFRLPDVLLVKRVHNFESIKRPLEELVDQRFDGQFDKCEMMRLLKLGVSCTRSDPNSRPGMRQIVSILDGNDEILDMIGGRKEASEDWEGKNETALSLVRRIKALGIH
ncbi:receptor lectin kinase [Rhynchospora pubera]|uniref:Receptor lectin kinase n=1 Tax=Rhynchospora pubera TaxID=906938 RepID=A0AAV8C9B6_9POAL|nr:receptor lectin kinase [Rhynchospora pubera]